MDITIQGRQSDMRWGDQQRTRRCLSVLRAIGFDINLNFTGVSEDDDSDFTRPALDGECPITGRKRQPAGYSLPR
jgi:hypothetical protein